MDLQEVEGHQVVVSGISGSLRAGSYSRKALRIALKGAAELGVETYLIDLREYDLPFCDGSNREAERKPDVERLRHQVKQAQGVILSTPEYHGSFSGVLKNALDLMGFDEFEGKMLGLLSVSGGPLGGLNGLNSLRAIGRTLHSWVIPEEVSIPRAYKEFDDDGNVKEPDLRERILELGRQVARFAFLHTSDRTNEFVRLWEEAPMNPGAKNR
ncbi:MAG TPA: NADPH-dependent FMN reductase [bacterium]|nr:NADPH-dependent FMN reductase [bacterium]